MASPGELLSDQEEDAAVPPCCGGHILSHHQGQCQVSYGPDLVHWLEPVTERCCTLVTTGGHEAGRRHIQAEQPKRAVFGGCWGVTAGGTKPMVEWQ